jgi:hypothetical protein
MSHNLIGDFDMTSKHTPGPWCICGNEKEATIVRAGDGIATHVARLHEMWICDEHGGSVIANARLIAAAPDLLAALADMVDALKLDTLQDGGQFIGEAYADLFAAAQNAIAKARGQS